MDKEALNKKLAEWAGFRANKKLTKRLNMPMKWWFQPDGENHYGDLPNFTKSLDACFKWLVPPVEEKGLTLEYVSFRQASGTYYAEWGIFEERDNIKCGNRLVMDFQQGEDLEKITALALCLAIEKLIEDQT